MLDLLDIDNKEMSRIGAHVCDSIQRHTSYLKEPQVIFALFDENLKSSERQEIASALDAVERPDISPDHFKPGKLSEIPLVYSMKECVSSSLCMNESDELFPKNTLASLVVVKSYLLFNLLKIEDLSWLKPLVSLWRCFLSYMKVKSLLNDLAVVNDGAERGIKLMQELIDRTEDEAELQHLAQCVSHHRRFIGFTKKDYEKLDMV